MIERPAILAITLLLGGCDIAALLADPKVVQREADAKAIGGACRHGLRSIEDCYSLNEKAQKSSVYAGWKEMDQYMRENKIEGVPPMGLKPTPAPKEEIITEPKEEAVDSGKSKTKTKAAH
jgi:hypothetical protein